MSASVEPPLTVIGILSGTSADAMDAAVVAIRQLGTTLTLKLLGYIEYPFRPETHDRLIALLTGSRDGVAEVCELNRLLAEEFAQAAHAAVRVAGLAMEQVDLIASHGQTVYHQVRNERARSTLQIGAPAVLAERTGRTVAADFRTRDVAAGGHGAPLAPYLDKLLWADPQRHRALQNIGGIANVTFIPAGAPDDLLAFDTGPGNALIDQAARLLSSGRITYDHNGSWAAQGRVDNRA
jgi:anhydro-N-acetylmuramic acid kinase